MDTPLILGNAELDAQHQVLHRTLLQLFQLAEGTQHPELFHDSFSRYTSLLHEHFVTEERIMSTLGLDDADLSSHREAHTKLLGELTNTHLLEMKGLAPSPRALCEQLSGWLMSHLESFDRPLAQYFPT